MKNTINPVFTAADCYDHWDPEILDPEEVFFVGANQSMELVDEAEFWHGPGLLAIKMDIPGTTLRMGDNVLVYMEDINSDFAPVCNFEEMRIRVAADHARQRGHEFFIAVYESGPMEVHQVTNVLDNNMPKVLS